MIQIEYVQFETAKLLKEAGYPQDDKYHARYNRYGQDWHMGDGYDYLLKPTQAQAMRWLRERKKLSIRVNYFVSYQGWFFDMLNLDTEGYCEDDEYWDTYEEAAEAGIQAACKYLIEKGGEE